MPQWPGRPVQSQNAPPAQGGAQANTWPGRPHSQAPQTDAEREAVQWGMTRRQLVEASSGPIGAITAPIANAITDPETRAALGRNVQGVINLLRQAPSVDYGRVANQAGARISHDWSEFASHPLSSIGQVLQSIPHAVSEMTVAPYQRAEQHAMEEDVARARGDTEALNRAAQARANDTGHMGLNIAAGLAGPLVRGPLSAGALGAAITGPTSLVEREGTLQERLPEVIGDTSQAAITSAALGEAGRHAPTVIRGVGGLLRRPASAVSEATSRFAENLGRAGGEPTPAQVARGRDIGTEQVYQSAQRIDPTGERLSNNRVEQSGKPIMAAEALGREMETQLNAAGRRSGQTPDALEGMLLERASERPARVLNDFAEASGISPDTVEGDFSSLLQQRRAQANPAYERFYGFNGRIWNERLASLIERPSMQRALREALEIAKEEGVSPMMTGITETPEGVMRVETPTARTWDLIKRGADQVIDDMRNDITGKLSNVGTKGRSQISTLEALRSELTNPETAWGPLYREALDLGGEAPRMQGAFRDAGRLMSNTTPIRAFNDRLGGMSASEMDALRSGVIADARNRAMSGRQRLVDMTSRTYEAKLLVLFGEERGRALIQRIKDEQFLLTHGNRMRPGTGSVTQELNQGMAEQNEGIRQVSHAMRLLNKGKWGQAIAAPFVDAALGFYRGAQIPLDRAARDAIGELLMLPPSELAQVLKDYAAKRGRQISNLQALEARQRLQESLGRFAGANAGAQQDQQEAPYSPSRALNQAISPASP